MNLRDLIQTSIRDNGLKYLLELVADVALDEAKGIKIQADNPDWLEDAKDLREKAKEIKELAENTYV